MTIAHKKISAAADTGDASLVQASDWNDEHGYSSGAMVFVGWATYQIAPGVVEWGKSIPFYIVSGLTRVSAGSWKFTAARSVFEGESVLPGCQITYYPTLSTRARGALTAGYYFAVGGLGDDIYVELYNSSDANVDPNVRVDITVHIFARVTPITP